MTDPDPQADEASIPLARSALADALALLLPTECGGCGAPDRAVCGRCRSALRPETTVVPLPAGPAARTGPAAGAGIPVWAALDYDGVLPPLLSALKERGRTDVARALAEPLGAAVRAALGALPGAAPAPAADALGSALPGVVALLPVPSSRRAMRTRGYDPVRLLLRRARPPAPVVRGLRIVRRPRDQAGLAAAERERNLRGAMRCLPLLAGRPVLLVDDVLTTGATLREAARAAAAAGAAVAGAVVLARVPKRH